MSLWCSLTYDIYDEYCSEEEAFAVGIVHVVAYVVLMALLIGNRGRLQQQLGLEKTTCANCLLYTAFPLASAGIFILLFRSSISVDLLRVLIISLIPLGCLTNQGICQVHVSLNSLNAAY